MEWYGKGHVSICILNDYKYDFVLYNRDSDANFVG
jgi:hypothetical protein